MAAGLTFPSAAASPDLIPVFSRPAAFYLSTSPCALAFASSACFYASDWAPAALLLPSANAASAFFLASSAAPVKPAVLGIAGAEGMAGVAGMAGIAGAEGISGADGMPNLV